MQFQLKFECCRLWTCGDVWRHFLLFEIHFTMKWTVVLYLLAPISPSTQYWVLTLNYRVQKCSQSAFWVWQLFFSVLAGWIWVTWKHYHDALGQIAEDSRLQFKVLSADDGVGHAELEEERLEHFEDFTWSQTKTLRGQTESLCLPSGDGVWDLVLHIHSSRLSEIENTHKQTKDKFRLWFAWGFSKI